MNRSQKSSVKSKNKHKTELFKDKKSVKWSVKQDRKRIE